MYGCKKEQLGEEPSALFARSFRDLLASVYQQQFLILVVTTTTPLKTWR